MPNYVTQAHFDQTVEKLITRDEFRSSLSDLRHDLMTKMDSMTIILQRLDQERVFTVEWIRQVESDIEMLKKHLSLA
jgi:hypothetical protein